jgi:hypothetical protein
MVFQVPLAAAGLVLLTVDADQLVLGSSRPFGDGWCDAVEPRPQSPIHTSAIHWDELMASVLTSWLYVADQLATRRNPSSHGQGRQEPPYSGNRRRRIRCPAGAGDGSNPMSPLR